MNYKNASLTEEQIASLVKSFRQMIETKQKEADEQRGKPTEAGEATEAHHHKHIDKILEKAKKAVDAERWKLALSTANTAKAWCIRYGLEHRMSEFFDHLAVACVRRVNLKQSPNGKCITSNNELLAQRAQKLEVIGKMMASGHSLAEIAKVLGVSRQNVHQLWKKHGTKPLDNDSST